jgi:hypothetical protein
MVLRHLALAMKHSPINKAMFIACLAACISVLLLALAFSPLIWLRRLPPDHWLASVIPVLTFAAVLAAILAATWVSVSLREAWLAYAELQAKRRREAEIEALQNSPFARWYPLAKRLGCLQIERWDDRYQALLADPQRQHHAANCLQGVFLSDEEIDYFDNPTATRCCEHLRPVELALRTQGFSIRLIYSGVSADARIEDEAVFHAMFALPASVTLEEIPEHRDMWASQELICLSCDCVLSLVGGPVFPRTLPVLGITSHPQ